MFQIRIPKPCHEDRNQMTPTAQGAFCAACSKEVVDFTSMTDEEVQHFFLNNRNTKTCGHFRNEQINRIQIHLPENILLQRIAGWKKFMAVVMLAFGSMLFGCDVQTNVNESRLGKVQLPSQQQKILTGDTVFPGQGTNTNACATDSLTLGTPAITMGEPIALSKDTIEEVPRILGRIELAPNNSVEKEDTTNHGKVLMGKVELKKPKG
jgi:hypothetical protein